MTKNINFLGTKMYYLKMIRHVIFLFKYYYNGYFPFFLFSVIYWTIISMDIIIYCSNILVGLTLIICI